MGRTGHVTRKAVAAAVRAVGLAKCLFASEAGSQTLLDEVRLGVLAHSIESSHAESGTDINVEVLFRRPQMPHREAFADFLLRPRMHVGTTINTIGDTSQVYAGLSWDLKLTERLTLEASFGAAWHDGPTGGPAPDLYGCRFNFREALAIGYALDDTWTVYGLITHMSNADLCAHNSGMTSAGVRIGYKFR